jgi:hypothetical protein
MASYKFCGGIIYIVKMSAVALPKELQYAPSLPTLPPDTINTSVVVSPCNGQTFSDGSIVQIDLPSSGFLDPETLYLRYKLAVAQSGATGAGSIKGTPAVMPIVKLEVLFGSKVVSTIMNYNLVYNMVTNLQMTVAQKYGAVNLGINNAAPSLVNANGSPLPNASSTSYTMALPLSCILSACEHLVPLFAMPNVRIQLTLDTGTNIIVGGGSTGNTITLSNIELCFDKINFGYGVEQMVRSMGDKLYIKAHDWATMSQPLTSGVQNTNELIFNARFASVRSLFTNFAGQTVAKCVNGNFDSVDVTSGNGDYQYFIAGKAFPDRSISTLQNKAGAIMELKMAMNGGLHSLQAQNMSLTSTEFFSIDTTVTAVGAPGKFWVGANTEKFSTAGALLSGVSTQNSPVSLRMNIGTATTQAYNVTLIVLYDALIELDMVNKNADVRQ